MYHTYLVQAVVLLGLGVVVRVTTSTTDRGFDTRLGLLFSVTDRRLLTASVADVYLYHGLVAGPQGLLHGFQHLFRLHGRCHTSADIAAGVHADDEGRVVYPFPGHDIGDVGYIRRFGSLEGVLGSHHVSASRTAATSGTLV